MIGRINSYGRVAGPTSLPTSHETNKRSTRLADETNQNSLWVLVKRQLHR